MEEKCVYCGIPIEKKKYCINPGAKPELYCCDTECYQKMKEYIRWDEKNRKYFYGLLFVFVVANLVLINLHIGDQFRYLPMLGICLTVFAFPMVFSRYERYRMLGLVKTRNIVRGCALLLGCIAAYLNIMS